MNLDMVYDKNEEEEFKLKYVNNPHIVSTIVMANTEVALFENVSVIFPIEVASCRIEKVSCHTE